MIFISKVIYGVGVELASSATRFQTSRGRPDTHGITADPVVAVEDMVTEGIIGDRLLGN